jgi:chromosome partitioning protein
MILTIGGIKGGSGKTTIATNLCQMRSANGKKVLLVDADEQQSSYEWSLQRDHRGLGLKSPTSNNAVFVTVCLTGKALYSNIIKMKNDYDDIIIDTGGRDTTSQRAAICCSDKILFPFKPRSIDMWTLGPVKRLIEECSAFNASFYAFLNQADHQGKDNEEALTVLKETNSLHTLPICIKTRKSFANACADGLGVHEIAIKDEKACKEIQDLYDAIYV